MPTRPPCDVTYTLFRGVRTAPAGSWSGSWQDFVAEQLPSLLSERRGVKKRLPGFILAEVEGKREDANTGAHTALAIDVDSVPDNDLPALLEACSAYTCAVYETASSTDEAPRVRVITALAKPLRADRVVQARLDFAAALGLDPAECGTAGARPPSQVMFVGQLRRTRSRALHTYDGRTFRPPRAEAPALPERKPPRPAPLDTDRHASASGRRGHATDAGVFPFHSPPDLSAIAKHVPPAGVDGDRHALCRAIGGWLARRGYDPEAIADAVRLQLPSSDPAERAAQAQDAAQRVRAGLEAPGWGELSAWAQRHARGAKTLAKLERLRDPREPADGFGDIGCPWSEWWAGYLPRFRRARERRVVSDAEGGAVAVPTEQDETGLNLHPATGWPWILQKGNSFWLHRPQVETYRQEVQLSELEASVARNLAGLVSVDDRKPTELRAAWVKVLDVLRSTYTDRTHVYDPDRNALTLAALRWTGRTAQRHTHIDRWLRALFGPGYDAAAQWLAALTDLNRPAPCLYLPGPRGLGKSLLADGLAALWSRPAPAKMKEAISDFNESTAECPLVFTDEGFPDGLNFSEFREMVTAHSRRVNAKYRSKCDVEGCARFMIAANNEDVLRYQKIGTLTADDLDAIADRLLVVPCHVQARAAVQRIDTNAAAGGEIAEHVLWLAETVELQPARERMAAAPGGSERILAAAVVGRSAEVLLRIREAMAPGSLAARMGVACPRAARAADEVWVNLTLLGSTFDGRVPLSAVRECCEAFQTRGTEVHKIGDEDRACRVLSRSRLLAAFERLD